MLVKTTAVVVALACLLSVGASPAGDMQAKIYAFVTWLEGNGASFPGLTIGMADDPSAGLCVRASRHIDINDFITVVPVALALNHRAALESEVVGPLCRQLMQDQPTVWGPYTNLILLLMYEAHYNPNSFWKPYFDLLPRTFEGHPSWAFNSDRQLMFGLMSYRSSRLPQSRLNTETLDWLASNVFGRYPAYFGVDSPAQRERWAAQMLWCVTIVDSRAYGPRVPVDTSSGIGAGDADTLIPLLDLLNHHDFGSFSAYLRKPGAIEPFQASDIEAYVKQATFNYEAGDEVWAKYFDVGNANEPVQGSALSPSSCNEIILNTWGFVLPGGTHDCVKVWVNLGMRESYNEPAGQARFAAQENALVGLAPLIPGLQNSTSSFPLLLRGVPGAFPPSIVALFRILHATSHELTTHHDASSTHGFLRPISLANERAALQQTKILFQSVQATVRAELEATLAALSPDPNAWKRVQKSIVAVAEGQVRAANAALRDIDNMWLAMLGDFSVI